ncbi:MAG: hypothetical protein R3D26_14190 [Cyanobacteriota/Melainabacteria group bacterium]
MSIDTAVGANLPPELMGPLVDATGYHFGVNVVAIGVVSVITAILIFGGVSKSAS